jgi:hypothetical protein
VSLGKQGLQQLGKHRVNKRDAVTTYAENASELRDSERAGSICADFEQSGDASE